jgi:hypothetical protein
LSNVFAEQSAVSAQLLASMRQPKRGRVYFMHLFHRCAQRTLPDLKFQQTVEIYQRTIPYTTVVVAYSSGILWDNGDTSPGSKQGCLHTSCS